MAPGRPKKRGSDESKRASTDVATLELQRSPIKQRKMGITLRQKQALIDNLQLEITERARRLRAQYHLQAQGLRSRIEIRLNRIAAPLRKLKMEELLQQVEEKQKRAAQVMAPPAVPLKDAPNRSPRKPVTQHTATQAQRAGRVLKRTSDEISYDKENDVENMEHAKKKTRGQVNGSGPVRPAQILSPTSSNSRLNGARPASPAKSQIARPGSPLKTGGMRTAVATNLLSNIVEKAKSSRVAGGRKVTTISNSSSSTISAAAPAPAPATRTRRAAAAAAPAAPRAPASRPATRTGRRISTASEASDGSTNTVVRKTAAKPTAAAAKRKGVLASFTKSTASGDAKKTTKAAAPATTRTGRVLRNRA